MLIFSDLEVAFPLCFECQGPKIKFFHLRPFLIKSLFFFVFFLFIEPHSCNMIFSVGI